MARKLAIEVTCFLSIFLGTIAFGQEWEVFTTEDGLPSDRVTAVYADKITPGQIWVGTDQPGVTMYCNGAFQEFRMPDLGWSRGSDPGVICQRGNEIWLVSGELGTLEAVDVFCLDEKRNWHMAPDTWGCWIYGLGTSPDGMVYITTEDSLSCFSGPPDNLAVTLIAFADSFANPFQCQLVSRNGTVYVASYCGDFYSFRNNELVSHESAGRFREMAEDSLGGLWAINDSWGDACMHRPFGSSKWSFVNDLLGFTCKQISTGGNATILVYGRDKNTDEKSFLCNDGSVWTRYNSSCLPGQVNDLCIDKEGNWWVATDAGLAVRWCNLPPLPMFVGVETDASRYAAGETMQVRLDLVAEGEARRVDLYVALEMPSGELLFYPAFGAEMTPFLSGIEIPANTHLERYELFSLTLPDLPAGTYRWYAALTHAGTTDFASNIASCDWQFTKE